MKMMVRNYWSIQFPHFSGVKVKINDLHVSGLCCIYHYCSYTVSVVIMNALAVQNSQHEYEM